jgi:hypothetical protein
MEYTDLVHDVFSDETRKRFIIDSLRDSMTDLGFSDMLRDEFLQNIDTLTVADFIERHANELQRVQNEHFFGELVPVYFKENVVPEIPTNGKVLDLGCGPAVLVQCLIPS